jgi:hypothetical protein
MFASYLATGLSIAGIATLFCLAAVWPLCKAADLADREMGLK